MKMHILIFFLFISSRQAQKKTQDTLFFKFDNSYVKESSTHLNEFYLMDRNDEEMFFFKGNEILLNLKPKEIFSLKKTIRQSKFYNKSKKQKINDYELMIYFRDKVVYMVRKKNGRTEYIHVLPTVVISD